jgi:hypothetical protein
MPVASLLRLCQVGDGPQGPSIHQVRFEFRTGYPTGEVINAQNQDYRRGGERYGGAVRE